MGLLLGLSGEILYPCKADAIILWHLLYLSDSGELQQYTAAKVYHFVSLHNRLELILWLVADFKIKVWFN